MTKPKRKNHSVRLAAAQTVRSVIDQHQSLDDAIESHCQTLEERDHPLYKAISYGSIRWALWYQSIIDQRLKKPLRAKDRVLNALLIVALYELEHMRSAHHAVVDEAVKATWLLRREWAKGLVNALLRNHLREVSDKQVELEPKQLHLCYPAWLAQQIRADWPDHADNIMRASLIHPPMTLRINLQKVNRDTYLKTLSNADITAQPCADSPIGVTLDQAINVASLPGFDQGAVSVQDESAQLSVLHLNLQAGHNVLDACAAPGGKTGHILETEPDLSALTAVDFEHRLDRLHVNMQRLGFAPNVVALSKEQADNNSWWDGAPFDRVLLDVPCSSTGVMRRHPDIKFRRNPENSLQFVAQQNVLLQQCWAMLNTGGQLMYTTCSIMNLENDQQISQFLASQCDAKVLSLPDDLGLKTSNGRQRLPGVHNGDGFYYSLLEKC